MYTMYMTKVTKLVHAVNMCKTLQWKTYRTNNIPRRHNALIHRHQSVSLPPPPPPPKKVELGETVTRTQPCTLVRELGFVVAKEWGGMGGRGRGEGRGGGFAGKSDMSGAPGFPPLFLYLLIPFTRPQGERNNGMQGYWDGSICRANIVAYAEDPAVAAV
jgi:hypothetical protein